MKRVLLYLIFLPFFSALISCNSGLKVEYLEYYPKFLWKGEGVFYLEKTLTLNFSEDAKADKDCFVEYGFVNNDLDLIPIDEMEIIANGTKLGKENKFKVYSSQDTVNIKLRFYPNVKSGKHQGYLRLLSHNHIDRQGNINLVNGQQENALQWTIRFEKRWNPLARWFFWIGDAISAFLLFYFAAIKPVQFPKFKAILKTFNIPGMAPLIIHFKGARKVVIAATHQKKQSGWNRLWTGKIIYITHPAFVNPITFKPHQHGHSILAVYQAGTYQVTPNPIPGIGGSVSIVDLANNRKINVI